jgi:hypothetical protein
MHENTEANMLQNDYEERSLPIVSYVCIRSVTAIEVVGVPGGDQAGGMQQ